MKLQTTEAAPYPMPLADFIETDRYGYTSLSYPIMTGRLKFLQRNTDDGLQQALKLKGSARTAALKSLAKSVSEYRQETDLIEAQWDAELESRRQRRAALPSPAVLP